jgi:fatty-acyl-CoA synthase
LEDIELEKVKVKTLADIVDYEKISLAERLSARTTYEMLKKGSAINPDAPAISFFFSGEDWASPEVLSYRDLMSGITKTANMFNDMGIRKGDVISYLLPNLPQTHLILWGGEAAGIVNPINYLLEPSTIADICRAAGTKVLVAFGEAPGWDIWQKAEAVKRELSGLKAVVRVMGPGDEKNGIYSLEEMLPRYRGDLLESGRVIEPEDIASMYHTGGTTGTPKLAPHTHLNEAFMAYVTGATIELNTGETTMCGLPLFHVNGTTVTGSTPFSMGAHVVILSARGYRDPAVMKNFYRIAEHYRAVTFSSVPTILSVLLDTPKGEADLSSLRFVVCGAAPLSVELFKRFEAHSGLKIIEGYGLTEGTCVSSLNPFHGERKIGSIGLRLPYQDMKIFIVDEEGVFVREADTGEIGAVCIRGPNVFKGYLDPVHNRKIWAMPGWLNTGDLGRQDEDGYIWLTGRKKELIIRGGHNIDPASIEEPLYRMKQVKVAAAVGSPDPYAGEVPVAYVELKEGESLSEEEIISYLKKEVGERAAVPKRVFVVSRMPLTPVGKIFKPALRWEATRQVFVTELAALKELCSMIEVKVGEDKVHGLLATITIRPAPGLSEDVIRNKVKDLLGRYAVHYTLKLEQ